MKNNPLLETEYEPDKGTILNRVISKKVSKESAVYRPASKNSKERCSECEFYNSPGDINSTCAKVVGAVDAEWTCDLFKSRTSPPNQVSPLVRISLNLAVSPNG